LTLQLSALCDQLLATDVSETALAEASRRCAGASNVAFRRVASAVGSFEGCFDLIVLSEVLYYWDEADLAEVAERVGAVLRPDGRLLMVHWLGETNYPMTADDAVSAFGAGLQGPFAVERSDRTQDYRLDLWRWKPTLSSDGRAAAPGPSPKGGTPE
jgi:SAM-dependent methyltransferase